MDVTSIDPFFFAFLFYLLLPALSATLVYFSMQKDRSSLAAYRINLGLVVIALLLLGRVVMEFIGLRNGWPIALAVIAIALSLLILVAKRLRMTGMRKISTAAKLRPRRR